MAILSWLNDDRIATPEMQNFWRLRDHQIPTTAGAYILIAAPGTTFTYPSGESSVFYIGMASYLRARLRQHLKYAEQARSDRQNWLYWARYEYAAAFGGRYAWVPTWPGMGSRNLEYLLMALFAKKYHSFPVANGAGAWKKIESVFSA